MREVAGRAASPGERDENWSYMNPNRSRPACRGTRDEKLANMAKNRSRFAGGSVSVMNFARYSKPNSSRSAPASAAER
jgi:hypothetical protein